MNTSGVQLSTTGFNYIPRSSYFESKHKSRPSHFISVDQARLRRTERTTQHRKSARLSVFDNARNISPLASPVPVSTVPTISDRRRRLQQWKEEKEKKKQEEASKKKKKPFVVGAVHAPIAFEPPPPIHKPSTSGRVTRSQSTRNRLQPPVSQPRHAAPGSQGKVAMNAAEFLAKLAKPTSEPVKSFAPVNAVFNPPKIDMPPMPILASDKNLKTRTKKLIVTFDPVDKASDSTKARLPQSKAVENKRVQKTNVQAQKARIFSKVEQPKSKVTIEKQSVLAPKENTNNARANRLNSRTQNKLKADPIKIKVTKPNQTKPNQTKKPPHVKKDITPKKKSLDDAKSESSVEEKLKTPDEPTIPTQNRPSLSGVASLSPFVTVSRGKKNARRETISKIKDGVYGDDSSDEKNADDFRNQLNSEIQRLTILSDDWEKYAAENVLPDNIQELVLAAIGQTRLLISKKLQQFSELIELCASGVRRPEGAVNVEDLQGFWDMIFMQVVDIDMRFKKLSALRDRQWVQDDQPQPKQKAAARRDKKKPAAGAGASSKIRAMIEAARKTVQTSKTEGPLLSESSTSKRFDAGFFSVTSPVRDVVTPSKRRSLLRDVLSSEARRASANKDTASRAMMRSTQFSKSLHSPTPHPQTSPLATPLINLEATPARGILKTPNTAARNTRRKSAKQVLFDEHSPTFGFGVASLPLSPEQAALKPEITQDIANSKKSEVISQKRSETPELDDETLESKKTSISKKRAGTKSKKPEIPEHNVEALESKTTKTKKRSGSKSKKTNASNKFVERENVEVPETKQDKTPEAKMAKNLNSETPKGKTPTRRMRSTPHPGIENTDPGSGQGSNLSPPRRLTRNMRRSILQDTQA